MAPRVPLPIRKRRSGFHDKMNMPPGGIFKKFPLVCVMVLDLILYGGSGAAALPDVLKTKVTVNQEAKLLSVAVQDRVLTVAVLPGENHENPFIDISGWDSEKRFQVAFSDVASVIFIDLYEILPGFRRLSCQSTWAG